MRFMAWGCDMQIAAPVIARDFQHADRLATVRRVLAGFRHARALGFVTKVGATTLQARFEGLCLGAICRVVSGDGAGIMAEVIALDGQQATLSVMGDAACIRVNDRLASVSHRLEFPFHADLPGCVVDGLGRPLSGAVGTDVVMRPAYPDGSLAAMDRPVVETQFHTGVDAVDGFLSLGQGQRIALFGPPGCGKSMLLARMLADSTADVVVLALVGERGREVQEFLQRHIPPAVRRRTVLVVATSDRPALERVYAAHVASSIAEGFRDAGKNVLLMVDSLTRVARALREIGLAAGEPAVRRGFPASVYPALPRIIERAGRSEKGDITAIYAVLVEGDSNADPIADEIKSLTDGHIELSREHAAAGRFPAIDLVKSLSRCMTDVVGPEHMALANKGRRLLAKFEELKLLIQIGEYEEGADSEADEAIARIKPLRDLIHGGGKPSAGNLRALMAAMRKAVNG